MKEGKRSRWGAPTTTPLPLGTTSPPLSQFDSRSGLMTTPASATSSSSVVPSFVPTSLSPGVPSPSPSNLSAFQSYEGFGGHWAAPSHPTDRQ